MSVIKVDYGEVGGGIDISGLIGKIICTSRTIYSTKEFITAVVGINHIEVKITGTTCQVFGYVGDTETELTSSYQTGTFTYDVSGYERISARSSGVAGYVVVTVVD